MFDNINVNPHKNEGFPTSISCIPIPDYIRSIQRARRVRETNQTIAD